MDRFEECVCFLPSQIQFNRILFRALAKQLTKLEQLKEESIFRKTADYEYEQGCIAEILEDVNEARIQFQVFARPIVSRSY